MDSVSINPDDSFALLAAILLASESKENQYEVEFFKSGLILEGNQVKAKDTSYYQFGDERSLFLWSKSDTAKTKWNVETLDSTNLVLKDSKSASLYFQRSLD